MSPSCSTRSTCTAPNLGTLVEGAKKSVRPPLSTTLTSPSITMFFACVSRTTSAAPAHVIRVRLAVQQNPDVAPMKTQPLHTRSYLRWRRRKIRVDENISLRRDHEIARKILASHVVKVVSNSKRNDRCRPRWVSLSEDEFRASKEKQQQAWQKNAHSAFLADREENKSFRTRNGSERSLTSKALPASASLTAVSSTD